MAASKFVLDEATYSKLSATMAQLGIAVRSFPSDIVLAGVRKIGEVCEENVEQVAAHAWTSVEEADEAEKVFDVCSRTAEKRALLEETAKALTAARVLIENAMNEYKDAAKEFDPRTAADSGLYVPTTAGRITLTDGD